MSQNVPECPPSNENRESEAIPVHAKIIPPRQVVAARLLTRGMTVSAVARALGVDRKTVTRWKARAAFRAAVGRAVNEVAPVDFPAASSGLRGGAPGKSPTDGFEFEGVTYATFEQYLAAMSGASSRPSDDHVAGDASACETSAAAHNSPRRGFPRSVCERDSVKRDRR